MQRIFTIGHSTHELSKFVGLLKANEITAVADVRSVPASRFTPQFNRRALERALRQARIDYVFLGKELGARSEDPSCYLDGRVQYARLASTDAFSRGIERIRAGAVSKRIAIMCTEQEPLDCHRTILIAKALTNHETEVAHVHGNGKLESHSVAMQRLLLKWGLNEPELFRTQEDMLLEALQKQEKLIAYVETEQPKLD